MTAADRPDPAALRHVLRQLREGMDESEAQERHAVLVTDPQTGGRQVIGPYPNRLHAKIGAALTKARNEQLDPELANLTYEVVLTFTPEEIRPAAVSFAARTRPPTSDPEVVTHVRVQVFAGPIDGTRALCGELIMRPAEADAFVALLGEARA